jgi:glycosyltransferase involved in cell wall biosynthesis
VIHSFHGVHQEPTLSGKIKFWLDRLLAPLTDHFIFASQSELNSALNAGFKTIEQSPILHPIVHAPPFEVKPRQYHNPIRFGSIARLDSAKGVDQLLIHLSYFKNQHPEVNWTYTHAGYGDQIISIPENIQGQVKFIGKIDNPYLFLKEIDLYLACSRNEAFNISVLEALNMNLPCLISNVPGHEFFIEAGVATGFKQDDSDLFSDKLLKMINSEYNEKNLESFLLQLSPKIISLKYSELITNIIQN